MISQVCFEPTRKIYNVERDKVLLQSLLQQGAPVQFECQFGHCRQCLVQVTKGFVLHDDVLGITDEEKKEGYVLLCSAKPGSSSLSLRLLKP
jgi:ring-1,2-phenylacetyl-CoA epoxidase subunit PaaE